MAKSRSEILIYKLVNNELTQRELDELLSDIKEPENEKVYTEVLREHFNKLVDKFGNKPDVLEN